nr:hypothetical protein [Sedimentibacter sp.]
MIYINTKVITFWSPVKRQGCSTNTTLYASYLSKVINETEKAVIFSINTDIDATDYITSNQIRNGVDDLIFLNDTNNINTKEDVLVYTHKLSENLDILGTGKNQNNIQKHYKKIIDLLSLAYDYILIDAVTGNDLISKNVMNLSDLIVVCLPQDRFVYEKLDLSSFENKKIIFLSSMHNEKNELNLNKIEAMVPVQVYKISRDDKINQEVYKQEVFDYITNEIKRKSPIINELGELHSEIYRLINIDKLNITYEIKKNFKAKNTSDSIPEPEIKVIKEYKFIKAKNNIAVINLSHGAGSTFITLNLAYMLKDKKVDASVIEVPHKNIKTDILNIICEDYESFEGESIIKNGIKFFINNKNNANWNQDKIIEHISLISRESNVNIYDVGSLKLEGLEGNVSFLFNIIDVAIIIIDPMPFKLLQAEERIKAIKSLEDKNINVIYVINKHIKDLNKKDIEKFLNVSVSSCVPFISPETLYAAYYSNHVVYRLEKSELFHNSLQNILSAANVIEYEKKQDKKVSKFNLFKWR